MGTTTRAKSDTRCSQCDQREDECTCDKYCCLCLSFMEVRLGQDGLYYCQPCREACEYF